MSFVVGKQEWKKNTMEKITQTTMGRNKGTRAACVQLRQQKSGPKSIGNSV